MPRCVLGARWTREDQIHITLKFLGEVEDRLFEETRQALAIKAPAFDLTLDQAGTFPPRGEPRILWIGSAANPALSALYDQIETSLEAIGFARERRPFAPHATLARLRTARRNQVDEHIEALRALALSPIRVDHFTLYSSVLDPKGAIYRVESEFLLG